MGKRMGRKDHLDVFGTATLLTFTALLGFNQVVVAVVNGGLQPVFFAALRSIGAAVIIYGWLRLRGLPWRLTRRQLAPGLLLGLFFGIEFIGLFMALDLTTVARASVLFYSMPLWAALGAHFLIPGERMTRMKAAGLVLAFAGVAWAIFNRSGPQGEASLAGDLCALLGAVFWAGIALTVRITPMAETRPETQLFWQLAGSIPVLVVAAPFFGPLLRDFGAIHLAGLIFQIVVIASAAFLVWLWLISRYPATNVTSFSFLSPIFGAASGWLVLDESIGLPLLQALAMVVGGLLLINRPPKPQVPQKV